MKDPLKFLRWRYYFFDLPLWAVGVRSRSLEQRMFKFFEPEIPSVKEGISALYKYIGQSPGEAEIDDIVKKTFLVKIVRESDAYACLKMTRRNFSNYFKVTGIEHLSDAARSNRPVVLLTAHFGSFYSELVGLSLLGIPVSAVARLVDYSSVTPLAKSLYDLTNYRLTELKSLRKYIFTDFSGNVDRAILDVINSSGILLCCIDLPKKLYPYKHMPVTFFGEAGSLPGGLIHWAIRKNAIFLTALNAVDLVEGGKPGRSLTIYPFRGDSNVGSVLQWYADLLAARVVEQPWQWLPLPIISQYSEKEGEKHG